MDYIIVSEKDGYKEYPILKNLRLGNRVYGISGNTLISKQDDSVTMVAAHIWQKESEGLEFIYFPDQERLYQWKEEVFISDDSADITIKDFPYQVVIDDKFVSIKGNAVGDSKIYLNGKKVTNSYFNYKEGDCLLINECKFTLYQNEMLVSGNFQNIKSRLLEIAKQNENFEGFPKYKRSPRIIKRVGNSAIEIQKPPAKSAMKKGSLVQMIVPPIMMMAITVGVSILMKRGLYVLISAAGTFMTLLFSIVKYFTEKTENNKKDSIRFKMYEKYLLRKRKEIYDAREKEIDAYNYNYPTLKEIEHMIHEHSSRIYERNNMDEDFLTVSVGHSHDRVSFDIKMTYDELAMEKDEFEEEANNIKKEFTFISNKPVLVDLKKAHLGLVGDKENIHEQLKLLIAQLTFSHSYHDLEIITIYNKEYEEDFKWINWYPHARIKAVNVYGSINNERMRDQVLGSVNQIIKERKQKRDESKKESRFLPHFLFIIDEPKLIMDHSIMEYLDKEGDELGFSIIYTTYLRANLPENIGTIVMLNNSQQGNLLLNQKEIVDKKFTLDHVLDIDLEWMARDLSVLEHMQGIVSQIPESITFFEMYQVNHPQELSVKERWKKNESHKSLAVPLGVRAVEDYVSLNLHEKAHGPHGLVAGTTGSGKSEIVQSYILSLAVNFHPYEVGFLLIDYKGGGMASLFKDLPHLLGTITNLDGAESMRAMASIKSELARRQQIFNENEVNHINAYNKLFKSGKVKEPIPHLFLISDEFAELKKEQPDFMKELVSAARIGRSLGIHLILATQKPSGVVDDQIWTNSKFKLALKVQNEGDSKEILKTPDAASITQAGRAYLQVGNNEIYELFQSAWSGATYIEGEEEELVDDRIYLVNELGQGELINQDLSGSKESNQLKATQLDVVVDHIHDVFEEEGAEQVRRPWLPSLENKIISPYALQEGREIEILDELDLRVSLGLVDIPEEQRQTEYQLNLLTDGNILYISSSGYGKSVMLTTLLLSLALKNKVENLHYYILDFGSNALITMNQLPHTAGYITFDDTERLNKVMKIIQSEMQIRKKLFAKEMVQNFDVYNQTIKEKLPAIVMVVDHFDAVKELGFDAEEFFNKLSRDGMGLGIYLIITATRSNAVKYSMLNNFKNKIAGYTFDESEANTLVGRSPYKVPEMKGRALVKLTNVNVMQIYTMVNFENDIEYGKEVKKIVEHLSGHFVGQKAPQIPVLPETLTYSMMDQYLGDSKDIVLGLEKETVETRGLNREMTPFVIVGDTARGKTNLLRIILDQITKNGAVYLFDSKGMDLFDMKSNDQIEYISKNEEIPEFMESLNELIDDRNDKLRGMLEEDHTLNPKAVLRSMEPSYIVIDDMDDFIELVKPQALQMPSLLRNAVSVGITIIITVHAAKLKGFDELSKFAKGANEGVVLSAQGTSNIFPVTSNRELPEFKDGLLFNNGVYERLRLPKFK